jgi:A/G-specific adenine glycosylase
LLLDWFCENARDLPWRRTRDPYAIWISEVMLQQTQVQTVIPYWERWMHELPDVITLARARHSRILKLWEGLGYYTRANNLHRAAKAIVHAHGGVFPRTFEQLLALPGIGRYTAGAICSIAFNHPTPILDGNVTRVLTRLYGLAGEIRSKAINEELWKTSQHLVGLASAMAKPKLRANSAFNQSLMELGAIICRPKNPECGVCPVQRLCVAHRTGRVSLIPNAGKRVRMTNRHFAAFVVCRGSDVLVRQRPTGAVNARLWEFPNVECTGLSMDVEELATACLGDRPAKLKLLVRVNHSITRYRIRLDAYLVSSGCVGRSLRLGTRWASLQEAEKLAFPSAHRRILRQFVKGLRSDEKRGILLQVKSLEDQNGGE